ncbi:DNA-binding transcriptional regulator, AcrR family [Halobacillus karajensis]|uniref:Copper outer membrane regulator n=1 Tax=Halobacillus karajensis TaxID=195088 RepID=A0A024P5G0_9BACI|nr:TetR/AcrR family transcriptional regulator [Halobacillus karajensis]CDQ20426.1 Copper outer membrane regulator [Halobacillus karajensis]CDQ24105.1 Copper outer membrane regulator [Halobacillus karajensis]CDQ27583.1 Copper outer membrane regulator [Halobacillus karajensis]SEH91842.1 DNA-binding transcriptional regulator, AcrR family [Halobacillus karajensis]
MTKESIIEESLKLFANYGYENTTLANIAEAVGIKKPSLYNHFDNKEDIFLHVLYDVADKEKNHLISQSASLQYHSVADHLHQIYRLYLKHMADTTEGLFFKRVTFFPPEEFTGEIKKVFWMVEECMTDILRPVFERGIDEKIIRPLSTDTLTSAFYTLMDGLFLEENFYDREVFEERQQSSWHIFWLGIQAPGE